MSDEAGRLDRLEKLVGGDFFLAASRTLDERIGDLEHRVFKVEGPVKVQQVLADLCQRVADLERGRP